MTGSVSETQKDNNQRGKTNNRKCDGEPVMAQNRPNILWFCTDQQRFDTV